MSIVLNLEYLEHTGGTKFYETVRLTDPDADRSILIKRWGPINNKHGGGQCKIERGGADAMHQAQRRIINEKLRGGYVNHRKSSRNPGNGFYSLTENMPLNAASVRDAIEIQWHAGDVRDAVRDFFPELNGVTVRPTGVAAAPKAVPWDKQELDRGESWGVF